MIDSELSLNSDDCDRQIEDVIDARKKSGEYNVCSQPNASINCRYAYSAPTASYLDDRVIHMEDTALWISEGDLNTAPYFDMNCVSIGQTDSEITLVRVKREGLQFKNDHNNWDMHDEAIPGDGTHLGESPSMVNLVTLVGRSISVQSLHANMYEGNEYLVPLSSWDPYDRPREFSDIQSTIEANPTIKTMESLYLRDTYQRSMVEFANKLEDYEIKKPIIIQHEHNNYKIIKSPEEVKYSSLAGKFSKFVKKHCSKKIKTLALPVSRKTNQGQVTDNAESEVKYDYNNNNINDCNKLNISEVSSEQFKTKKRK